MEAEVKKELIKGWLVLMRLRGGEAVEVETSGPRLSLVPILAQFLQSGKHDSPTPYCSMNRTKLAVRYS